MIVNKLIILANRLDSYGLYAEADMIEGIITKVHGKGPDALGDFEDLDETNITEDETYSAGHAVCEDEHDDK